MSRLWADVWDAAKFYGRAVLLTLVVAVPLCYSAYQDAHHPQTCIAVRQ